MLGSLGALRRVVSSGVFESGSPRLQSCPASLLLLSTALQRLRTQHFTTVTSQRTSERERENSAGRTDEARERPRASACTHRSSDVLPSPTTAAPMNRMPIPHARESDPCQRGQSERSARCRHGRPAGRTACARRAWSARGGPDWQVSAGLGAGGPGKDAGGQGTH